MQHFDNIFEVLTLTCDECGNEGEFRGRFKECIQEAKDGGWWLRTEPPTNEWKHYCSRDCAQR